MWCFIKIFQNNFKLKRCLSTTLNSVNENHPLKGVKVLDLTRIIAGPYCTMLLGDLGAQIIKIERPYSGGDETRKWGPPFLPNCKDSLYSLPVNRNKQSVCIDIKKGRDLIVALAKKCDILVENYVPGNLAKYGLDYEELKKVAPKLIYCSITGYGPVGPYAQKPGYDVIASAIGGLMYITGQSDGPFCKVGVPVTDMATGLYAHGAILAALLHRQKTGRGQKIDANLLSTQVSMLINVGSNYLNAGIEAKRYGTAHSSIVPYQSFQTANGYITLGAGSDEQFKQLCKLLQLPQISEDKRFSTNSDRVANREELIKLLSDRLCLKTSAEWMCIFKEAPFPVGPVNTIRQVFEDEHIKEIDLVKELPHPTDGSIKVVGPPIVFSEAENNARTAPPLLGQHTDEILQQELGYTSEQIQKLRDSKIVQ